jgi:hypothetical protein
VGAWVSFIDGPTECLISARRHCNRSVKRPGRSVVDLDFIFEVGGDFTAELGCRLEFFHRCLSPVRLVWEVVDRFLLVVGYEFAVQSTLWRKDSLQGEIKKSFCFLQERPT